MRRRDECKTQVDRFRGAVFKKFTTQQEARAFIGDAQPTMAPLASVSRLPCAVLPMNSLPTTIAPPTQDEPPPYSLEPQVHQTVTNIITTTPAIVSSNVSSLWSFPHHFD